MTISAPEAAVVISCFELGRMLPEAVDSALGQTRLPREVVVVDDGSEDVFTRQVVARLAGRGITVVAAEHRGPAHARNLGVSRSSAPYVVLLDGDDVLEPTYLERAADLFAARPGLSFVCCALQAFGRASYQWTPPPYSVADAIGRGACGHISTVFRREVWDAVGGFDEDLPAYEDVDFWLRALELGFEGAILDEALVRYRVRKGSRYHGTVVTRRYLPAKQRLAEKHAATVAAHGESVFATLLDFQREVSGHARSLATERTQLVQEIAELERELAASAETLRELAAEPFEWGALGDAARPAGEGVDTSILHHYLDRFVGEMAEPRRSARTLRIAPGDPWPGDEAVFDRIVIAGALEHADDPATALARCRTALRPGGVLLLGAGTMALRASRGFCEAGLRFLLCQLFPAEEVEVWPYGNQLASLALAAGLPAEALDEAELAAVDPWHPTLVAARARVPARGRRRRRGADRRRGGDVATPVTRGAILAYHRVAALVPDTHELCTTPDLFRAQMELIAQRFEPLPLGDLVARAMARQLPPGAVAVTFDDGGLDHLEVASPILGELGIPATFFVGSEGLDEPREAWWDIVERILIAEDAEDGVPRRLRLDLTPEPLDLPARSPGDRRAALVTLHGLLLGVDADHRDAIVAELAAWSGRELPVRDTHRMMTAEEIAELDGRPGHEVGAHGLNHVALTEHPEEVRLAELIGSKARLEEVLGHPVADFAYPFGMTDLRTTELAESAGFSVACTVEPDPVTVDADPLRVPRIEVGNVRSAELRFRLERVLSALPA